MEDFALLNKTRSDWQLFADSLQPEGRAYINGQFVHAQSGELYDNSNPATGRLIVHVAKCDKKDVDFAVANARETFNSGVWRRLSPAKRKAVLLKWAQLIEAHWEELAMLESLDTGKPISCTMDDDGGDVHSSIRTLKWTAECVDKLYGETLPHEQGTLGLVTREPVGVVAVIMPWNYPLATTMWKLAPALGAGNSVVLKPASLTPLTGIKIAELATQAGLPAGVLNVITGPGANLGKALGLHQGVDCIGFTGSTPIGKELLKYAGESNHNWYSMSWAARAPISFLRMLILIRPSLYLLLQSFSIQVRRAVLALAYWCMKAFTTKWLQSCKQLLNLPGSLVTQWIQIH